MAMREGKPKGVSSLIQVENPNRNAPKYLKVTQFTQLDDLPDCPRLSKRDRAEIIRERELVRYNQLDAEQIRADLERLVIIKHQREEAKRKRELEKQVREKEVMERAARAKKILAKRNSATKNK